MDDLRAVLADLPPRSRDLLRRALVGDQADRDTVAQTLLRYRDGVGDQLAEIIDMLTMNPDYRRNVARLPAEIDAAGIDGD